MPRDEPASRSGLDLDGDLKNAMKQLLSIRSSGAR